MQTPMTQDQARAEWRRLQAAGAELERLIQERQQLRAALEAAIERMEAVAESIPVTNRHKGVSQATHVAHMAGHLAQYAKIARAALAAVQDGGESKKDKETNDDETNFALDACYESRETSKT